MKTMQENLLYYKNNAKEAFLEGFTAKVRNECLKTEVYDVHKYYLPRSIRKRVKWIKKYFRWLDSYPDDSFFKRRKHHFEFAETALMILQRIEIISRKSSIVAGSDYVCALPWAVFGLSERLSQHKFETIYDLMKHYSNYLHGECYPVDLYFRCRGNSSTEFLTRKMASRFHKQPLGSKNYWMALSLALLYDILHYCGPDTHEFFELFTNDMRDSPDSIDFMQWQAFRCRLLGVMPPPEFVHPRHYVDYTPIKPRRVKTEITEISNNQDLTVGEKTTLVYVPKPDYDVSCLMPYGSVSLLEHRDRPTTFMNQEIENFIAREIRKNRYKQSK